MENWILKQITVHLENAVNRNKKMFEFMDTDKNSKKYFLFLKCIKITVKK